MYVLMPAARHWASASGTSRKSSPLSSPRAKPPAQMWPWDDQTRSRGTGGSPGGQAGRRAGEARGSTACPRPGRRAGRQAAFCWQQPPVDLGTPGPPPPGFQPHLQALQGGCLAVAVHLGLAAGDGGGNHRLLARLRPRDGWHRQPRLRVGLGLLAQQRQVLLGLCRLVGGLQVGPARWPGRAEDGGVMGVVELWPKAGPGRAIRAGQLLTDLPCNRGGIEATRVRGSLPPHPQGASMGAPT